MRIALLLVLLAGTALAADETPSQMVSMDLLNVGLAFGTNGHRAITSRELVVTAHFGRLRAGIALKEMYRYGYDDYSGAILPVHVGVTLHTRARRTGICYSLLPDIFAEVSIGLVPWEHAPGLRASLCYDITGFGVGLRAETGFTSFEDYLNRRTNAAYFELRARVLTATFAFSPAD